VGKRKGGKGLQNAAQIVNHFNITINHATAQEGTAGDHLERIS